MACRMPRDVWTITMGLESLAKDMGVGRTSTQEAVERLVDRGYLEAEKTLGKTTTYTQATNPDSVLVAETDPSGFRMGTRPDITPPPSGSRTGTRPESGPPLRRKTEVLEKSWRASTDRAPERRQSTLGKTSPAAVALNGQDVEMATGALASEFAELREKLKGHRR